MAESSTESPVTVEAVCQCGQLSASVSVPPSDLPIPTYLCSCDTCRHVSGQLCVTSVDIHTPLTIHGRAASYATSSGPNGLSRCFCATCGTTVYEDSPNPARLGLAGGALTQTDGVVKIAGQVFVGDTRDGGLRPWLPSIPAWDREYRAEDKLSPAHYVPAPAPAAGDPDERLRCKCHCGGVRFDVTRPTPASSEPHVDYTDETRPAGGSYANPTDEKWWLRENGTKYAATLCACNSCRKASGYDVQPWAFVPTANVVRADGRPYAFDEGTLKYWRSSPDVRRYFCGTCSATALYRVDDRPALVDVSVGLAEAASGARAEEWLSWIRDKVGYAELAQNRPLIGALEEGLGCAGKRQKTA